MTKLIEILENYTEAEEITAEMSIKNDLGLSSFDIVCMIDEIEAGCGITLKPSDFSVCKTVGALAEIIGV